MSDHPEHRDSLRSALGIRADGEIPSIAITRADLTSIPTAGRATLEQPLVKSIVPRVEGLCVLHLLQMVKVLDKEIALMEVFRVVVIE